MDEKTPPDASYPRDGDESWRSPSDVHEHKLGNERDIPEVPGPGGERWSQINPPGEQHPAAFELEGAPMTIKPTIVGPASRAREAATGDPTPNPGHEKLATSTTKSRTGWLKGIERASRGIRLTMTTEEFQRHRDILAVADNADMSIDERMAEIKRLDPDGTFTKMAIERGEADMKERRADLHKQELLLQSLELYRDWEHEETTSYTLQKNECSRLHKLCEACYSGKFYDGDESKFLWADPSGTGLEDARVFVVRHDWAAAFGQESEVFDPAHPFKIPYPKCVFEFRVSGHTVIMIIKESPEGPTPISSTISLEGVDGVWFSIGVEAMASIAAFCERQVRAISIALEAQVAEHEVTRAPAKLNAKRILQGKPPLRDFHVVDLARRIRMRSRAEARPDTQPTGRHVRMHFRRGHWRHLETHTVWIEWMLVGDPDLGFIDKHYRI